jgi:YfiH family protein
MPPGNGDQAHAYPLRVPAWTEIPHLVHGFLGREHGLPSGRFNAPDVADQLSRAGERPVGVAIASQVHGADVLSPEQPGVTHYAGRSTGAAFPPGDALVSASADVILTVRTADCVPILLVAPRPRAVAAIHAGWRGTVDGVIAAAIRALADRYAARPDEIQAAIGPAIGGCCYEFGAEHLAKFTRTFGPEVEESWQPAAPATRAAGRVMLDLRAVVKLALETSGVPPQAVTVLGPCTADAPAELHSYRRDGANAGRQLSYIGWRS